MHKVMLKILFIFIAHDIAQNCSDLLFTILHSIVPSNCTLCTHCSYCTYWLILPILAHYCTQLELFTIKLINTALACFSCPQAAACLLLIAALLTMLLSIQLLTDLTFKSTMAPIHCPTQLWPAGSAAAAGAAAPPLSSDPDFKGSPSSKGKIVDS